MSSVHTLGIDEAGRGPILGPMVLACVGLSEEASRYLLQECGIADSKQFGAGAAAHARRMKLVPAILQAASYTQVEVISVQDIDRHVFGSSLNQLEQKTADRMLQSAPPAGCIVADGARLFGPLRKKYPHLQARDRAESFHAAVAAASILAKTRRDEEWLSIVKRYRPQFGTLVGPGAGYPNAGTKRFLRAYCARYQRIPPEGRESWPWDFASDLLPDEIYESLVRKHLDRAMQNIQRQTTLWTLEKTDRTPSRTQK